MAKNHIICIGIILSCGLVSSQESDDSDIIIEFEISDETDLDDIIVDIDLAELAGNADFDDIEVEIEFPRVSGQTDFWLSNGPYHKTMVLINNMNMAEILSKLAKMKQIIFLINDVQEDRTSELNQALSAAFFQRLSKATGVIVVDWWSPAIGQFSEAVRYVRAIAADLAKLVSSIQTKQSRVIVFTGFGLGAHIAGFAGKILKKQKKMVSKIFGLDPSKSTFEGAPCSERLCKSDATYVRVLHTNTAAWGISDPIGHADFYFNGGHEQPGCAGQDIDYCSHIRSWLLFNEALRDKKSFPSIPCKDYESYVKNPKNYKTGTFLGDVNSMKHGLFCVNTKMYPPFSINGK